MKIPKAKKLPSGSWRVQITSNGQRISRTFPTEREAVRWAADCKTEQHTDPAKLTVGQAIDKYIESKDAVLSPATVAGYKRIRANQMQDIMPCRLDSLTQDRVQRSVNAMAKDHAPKTVRNAYGLLTAALAVYAPAVKFTVTLPQKRRTDIVTPTEADIAAIADAVRGTSAEAPTLLAMWLGLRMSEIRGLTWDCIKDHTVHIHQAMVDEGLKTTKTYNSDRTLNLPQYIESIINGLPHTSEYIFPQSRRSIASRFDYYIKKAGIKHYRFHDLRHIQASVMLLLNTPDKYAMKRMGHATDNMLKTVYQHTMSEQEQAVNTSVDNYFERAIIHNDEPAVEIIFLF